MSTPKSVLEIEIWISHKRKEADVLRPGSLRYEFFLYYDV
jgi:hypothetical protein